MNLTAAKFSKISSLLVLLGALLAATQGWAQSANPLAADPRAARAGGTLFRAQCATCHGADARGIATIDAPDLTLMWAERDRTEQEVFGIIRNGIPGSIMPPHGLPDAEVWMLVSYLRSVAVGGTEERIGGDARRGAGLFRDNCALCHRVDGVGGSLGPDLSGITDRRGLDALVDSIRNPAARTGRGFKPVRLVTGSNEEIMGLIKSEDAFTIQILDEEQVLRSFRKRDLRELDREVPSLMPPFPRSRLSDTDLDDLLSYLQSDR